MDIDWNRIETFVGFGRADAPVVFLGMEEGLRRAVDLVDDLRTRSTYAAFMDLADAQSQLDGPSSYFGKFAKAQNTWRPMCDLMLRREGVSQPTLQQRLRYQADRLGRRDGDTLLTELLPYPHSDTSQWLYARFGRFASREDFAADMLPKRRSLLRAVFAENRPALIVAYGKANWPEYKLIFDGSSWQEEKPFEIADWGSTRVVLAHQLAGRQFNTDKQLARFASIALAATKPLESVVATRADRPKSANRNVRDVFGLVTRSYRLKSGLSYEQISDQANAFAGQGNPGGIRNLENGVGWVDPGFAEGVFRAIGVPDAGEFGRSYRELKGHFGGVTREID